MKSIAFALLLFPFFAQASTEVIRLSADRASYAEGEKAVLRAMLASKPDNSTMEFDIEAKLDGSVLPITRITDFEFFSVSSALSVGTHEWSATVYLQDARLARDLKASMAYFDGEIAKIDAALESETDADKIAQLQAAKAKNQALRNSSQQQLFSIRTRVYGPVSINLLVN